MPQIRRQLQLKARLKEVYEAADKDGAGIVSRTSLEKMLRERLDLEAIGTAAQVPALCVARDVARFLDWNDSGKVSFAAFVLGLHAGGSSSLRSCLLEPMCIELYKNRTPFLTALRKYDDNGAISRANFVCVLNAMGEALREAKGAEVLTKHQIERLIESLTWVDDKLDYEAFLKSFCVVDTGRMSECASSGWHLLQAAFSPAMHSQNGYASSSFGGSFADSSRSPTSRFSLLSPATTPVTMSPAQTMARPRALSGHMLEAARAGLDRPAPGLAGPDKPLAYPAAYPDRFGASGRPRASSGTAQVGGVYKPPRLYQ